MTVCRFVDTQPGMTLTEEEFVGAWAYYSRRPDEEVWAAWRDGATLGSLILGAASIKDVYEK